MKKGVYFCCQIETDEVSCEGRLWIFDGRYFISQSLVRYGELYQTEIPMIIKMSEFVISESEIFMYIGAL